MLNLNPDQMVLDLKQQFANKGLANYFDLSLEVFKKDIKVIETIRAAATRLRELGFEAGIVLDTDEFYHEFFIRHEERKIFLSDSGTSEVVHSKKQDRMKEMANRFSKEEEELLAHFADLQRARERVYCNIMNTTNLILFPDFKVSRFETRKEKIIKQFRQ